ncbi:hypothetical protein N7448_011279 [Penicillium atrosanguineum]|nr:hypothetical protein N7448_011279 [Penicillium atrosanguineum]
MSFSNCFRTERGASDICLQLMAFGGDQDVPFQQAVMMSGAPGLSFNSQPDLVASNKCYRAATKVFVTASRAARPLFGEAYLYPTIDDDIIQDRPSQLTRAGNFAKEIPLIASWVTNDEAWYVLLSIPADDEVLANFGLWLHKLSESTKEKLFASCTDPTRKRFVLSPTI